MEELHIIGLMSGTSLDGLDIAACTFSYNSGWNYKLIHSKTVSYSDDLKVALQNADNTSSLIYAKLDHDLGRMIGSWVREFIKETGFTPDYISSHGHTVFHQPEKHFTTQIGHPSAITAITKIPVIADFRTVDVHLEGQGAPLVPIGDLLLFTNYKFCLNLGGIANISIKKSTNKMEAFDIGIANMALNLAANKAGKEYDEDGKMAQTGAIISPLLNTLNEVPFHNLSSPKSIGKEWFDLEIKPLLEEAFVTYSTEDILATLNEHISMQVGKHINENEKIFITGGGAKNLHLVSRIKKHCNAEIIIPSPEIVDYKEAIIFAFLGALHVHKENNIKKEITGSERTHIGGCIYSPFSNIEL